MEKYTTLTIKEAISHDKDISQELKDKEERKTIISNEAFAICDFIEKLINKMEQVRSASMR